MLNRQVKFWAVRIVVVLQIVTTLTPSAVFAEEYDPVITAIGNPETQSVGEDVKIKPMPAAAQDPTLNFLRGGGLVKLSPQEKTLLGKLTRVREIMSGFARKETPLEDILKARVSQEELKKAIDDVIAAGGEVSKEQANEFKKAVNDLDEIISRNPIIITLGGKKIEINATELFMELSRNYLMLNKPAEDGFDYRRLSGIAAAISQEEFDKLETLEARFKFL